MFIEFSVLFGYHLPAINIKSVIFQRIKSRYRADGNDISPVIFVALWNEWMSSVSIKTPMAAMKYIIQWEIVTDE